MSATEIPALSFDQLFSRIWRRRWFVALCGIICAVLAVATVSFSPKFEARVDVQPPSWEAIGAMNKSGLIQFDRDGLYHQFLRFCQARSTTQMAKRSMAGKTKKAAAEAAGFAANVQILGGPPRTKDPIAPQVLIATGSSQGEVVDFLKELTNTARQLVVDDARARLKAAVSLRQNQVESELSFLLAKGEDLAGFEKQRRQDRQAALQGARHLQVPLAFMDADELRAESARYEGLVIPEDLSLAATVDLDIIPAAWPWYSLWHTFAGLVIGILFGSWIAVIWKPSSVK